jgi:hypothetical protein
MADSAEKRDYDRFAIEFPAVCTRFNTDRRHRVTVKNCSEGGVYFEAHESFGPGIYVMLRKDGASKGADPRNRDPVKSVMVGQVRWSRDISSDTGATYGIGVRYVHTY